MDDAAFRKNLVELLEGGGAHVTAKAALAGINLKVSTVRPDGMEHSIWELLEHIRTAQEDILRYTLDAAWKSPAWPEGYWPTNPRMLTKKAWSESHSAFFSNLAELIEVVRNPRLDLTAVIPHGEGRTYLREILLTADHNAYHLGQIVLARRALGNWTV